MLSCVESVLARVLSLQSNLLIAPFNGCVAKKLKGL